MSGLGKEKGQKERSFCFCFLFFCFFFFGGRFVPCITELLPRHACGGLWNWECKTFSLHCLGIFYAGLFSSGVSAGLFLYYERFGWGVESLFAYIMFDYLLRFFDSALFTRVLCHLLSSGLSLFHHPLGYPSSLTISALIVYGTIISFATVFCLLFFFGGFVYYSRVFYYHMGWAYLRFAGFCSPFLV